MGEEQADPGELPLLPGFREMALRRMNRQRRSLVAELAEQRQAAGLSQTEIAARMGTSQSAVARLEAGEADMRASTLERYAAAVGSEITWRLEDRTPGSPQRAERPGSPQRAARPGSPQRAEQPGSPQRAERPGRPQ